MSESPPAPASPAPSPTDDPYVLTPDAIQEPPTTFFGALSRIGPGLILAGAIVGTGELIATTNLGAKVGFTLLWLVLFSCFIKVFVQVELGRYSLSSGETTLQAMRRVPMVGTLLTWWWLAMMLATQSQLSAMVGGTGHALHMLLPGVGNGLRDATGSAFLTAHPEAPFAFCAALATSFILAFGSYRLIEKGSLFLVAGFTFMTVVCVLTLPGGSISGQDLAHGLSFQIPAGQILLALGMFGITGVGASELMVYPYWCIEKGYARNTGPRDDSEGWLRRARGWMRVMQTDAWASMIVYTIATLSFYLLGAAVLHHTTSGQGLPNSIGAVMDALSKMYAPLLGDRLALIFIAGGAIAVLYSTLFAATAANSRAAADFTKVNGLVDFSAPGTRMKLVRVLCFGFPLIDLVLFYAVPDPVYLVTIGAVAQAFSLPMIAGTALVLRYRHTDARLRPGKLWDLFLILSFLAFAVSAAYGLYDQFVKFTSR